MFIVNFTGVITQEQGRLFEIRSKFVGLDQSPHQKALIRTDYRFYYNGVLLTACLCINVSLVLRSGGEVSKIYTDT